MMQLQLGYSISADTMDYDHTIHDEVILGIRIATAQYPGAHSELPRAKTLVHRTGY
jgi:hypothetical protein